MSNDNNSLISYLLSPVSVAIGAIAFFRYARELDRKFAEENFEGKKSENHDSSPQQK